LNKFIIIANDDIDENFKNVHPATNFVPDWYKKSPQKINGTTTELIVEHPITTTSTYKKCSPFLDALVSGYMVCLTMDIEVTTLKDGSPYIIWRSGKRLAISSHDNEQWNGLKAPQDSHNLLYKWENSFTFKTPKDYSIMFSHPANRFDLPFYTLSGVVDTDKYILPVKFPFFLKKDFTGIIEAGTPIAQINFIKRDEWERNFISFDKEKIINNEETFISKIKLSYKNNFWNKKVYK